MTVDPFTDEEHRARAMLLGDGWRYRRDRGYYVNMNSPPGKGMERKDVLTMEPISNEEYNYRAYIQDETRKDKWYG